MTFEKHTTGWNKGNVLEYVMIKPHMGKFNKNADKTNDVLSFGPVEMKNCSRLAQVWNVMKIKHPIQPSLENSTIHDKKVFVLKIEQAAKKHASETNLIGKIDSFSVNALHSRVFHGKDYFNEDFF